jgi:prefoldin subunit 5
MATATAGSEASGGGSEDEAERKSSDRSPTAGNETEAANKEKKVGSSQIQRSPTMTKKKEVGGDDDDKSEEGILLTLDDVTDGKSPRGIPAAKFVEDVQSFSLQFIPPASAEHMIGAYTELYQRYKRYESVFLQKKARLEDKIPELEKSLALIRHLLHHQQQQKEQHDGNDNDGDGSEGALCTVRYSLAESVYGRADVDTSDNKVNLWLGANVMLEYTYDEAIAFLQQNLNQATKDVDQLQSDIGFVRDQIVTSEVTMSRIYNWDVRRKREEASASSASAMSSGSSSALA